MIHNEAYAKNRGYITKRRHDAIAKYLQKNLPAFINSDDAFPISDNVKERIVIYLNKLPVLFTKKQTDIANKIGLNDAPALSHFTEDFNKVLELLQQAFGLTTCVPFTIPIGKEAELKDVIHVLRSNDVPPDLAEQVEKYKNSLMDTVAESNEDLMMRYLDGEELTEEEIATGLHSAIINGNLIPVFAGSVTKDIGITELMNGIVNLFGSRDKYMEAIQELEKELYAVSVNNGE